MNRPDHTADIHGLAADLTGYSTSTAQRVQALLAVHHTDHNSTDLADLFTVLAGETSVLRLLALVLEAKTQSKPVQALPAIPRHTVNAEIHGLVEDLDQLARTGAAETAAYELDPA